MRARMLHNLSQSWRRVRRHPRINLVIVGVIALGLASSWALSTLFDALVWRPLPVERPFELVSVAQRDVNGQPRSSPVSLLAEIQRHGVFQAASGYSGNATLGVDAGGLSHAAVSEFVTGEYFEQVLRVRPLLGRLITPQDISSPHDAAPVVVIGHAFWTRALGADPNALGRSILVEGRPVTIIGVTAPGFAGLRVERGPDVTLPLQLLDDILIGQGRTPTARSTYIIGRLHAGQSSDEASATLRALWPALVRAVPSGDLDARGADEAETRRLVVTSVARGFSALRSGHAAMLTALVGFTIVLLAVVCANAGGLLLVEADARRHELAIRMALGATRGQLLRQSFVDGMLLAAIGGVIALPAATLGAQALGALLWNSAVSGPATFRLEPDGRTLGWMAMVVLGVGAAIGGLPLVVWKDGHGAMDSMRGVTRAVTRRGGALVAIQVALCVVFLHVGGLLAASLANLRDANVGLDAAPIVVAWASPKGGSYTRIDTLAYYRLLEERLAAIPGVRAVAFSRLFPNVGDAAALTRRVGLAGASDDIALTHAPMDIVSRDFFHALNWPIREGRVFGPQDVVGAAPVVVVTEGLARQLFPAGSALGRFIRIGDEEELQRLKIVGVVADATMGNRREVHTPVVFRPWLQEPAWARYPTMTIATMGERPTLAEEVRRVVEASGAEYVRGVRTLDAQLDRLLVREIVLASLAIVFGAMALLLCGLGVYAMVSYVTRRRTPEMGVRRALGASERHLRWQVLRQAMMLSGAGVLIGAPGALIGGHLLRAQLFAVSPFHPGLLAAIGALVFLFGVAGAVRPAWRAARIDPAVALRDA